MCKTRPAFQKTAEYGTVNWVNEGPVPIAKLVDRRLHRRLVSTLEACVDAPPNRIAPQELVAELELAA